MHNPTPSFAEEQICYFPIDILGQVWYLNVSIPDICRLSYFVLASHRYRSTHSVEVVDILEKNKTELQNLPLQIAVFLEGVKTRAIPVHHLENLICH